MRYFACLFGFLAFFLLPLATVQAQEIPENTCYCYCTNEEGAEARDFVKDTATCRSSCEAEGLNILQCYSPGQEDNLPDNNNLCWTEEDCVAEIVTTNDGEEPSIWGGQERKCLEGRGYCYNPPGTVNPYTGESATANLGVAIGGLERPDDLAEYIAAVYKFLLPVGALLAILMFMIAGLQWMMARGDASKITAAKTRLGTATFGLVLLFLAYTIAVLIDPNLVNFNVFRVPKIQAVIYLDGGGSCENLINQNVTVEPSKGVCGDTGVVTSTANVSRDNAIIGVDEESTCRFSECSTIFERCAGSGGSDYECVRCNEVNDDIFGGTSLDPSAGTCASLSLSRDPDFAALDVDYYCEYVETEYLDGMSDTCAELIYPNTSQGLDCDVLRGDYEANCRAYDFVYALIDGETNIQVDDVGGVDAAFPLLENLCSNDPCGFAPEGDTCYVYALDGFLLGGEPFANCASAKDNGWGFSDCILADGTEGSCHLAADGLDPTDFADLFR